MSAASAARRAALDLLHAVRAGATFADARDRHLAGLPERDRRLAYELAAGVLRHQAALDHELDPARVDPRLLDILRLGAYQLRRLTRVPAHAAVSTSVELARGTAGEPAAKFVNQALRRLARETGGGRRGAEGEGEGEETHPRWLVTRWRRQFGANETERLIAWNDSKPPLTAQPARWDLKEVRSRFESGGIGVRDAPFGAGLRVSAARDAPGLPSPVSHLPGFPEGGFLVQDPAAALVCRFAAIAPGHLVYDACAAPGGKAVALERLGARVVAGDARRERLGRLVETIRRCGVAIRPLLADLLAAPFRAGALDAVLVDAPCSATGTMARHPDARWRLTASIIARAAARQRRLLDAARPLVRPGGLLIYATCSLEPEENTEVVDAFLEANPEFRRDPAADAVPRALLTASGDFQSLPQRHGIDGAYAARLRRSR
ncbi:MAG: RsmB/NOP family class I SAM-dependent RNA methyltransferase [Gemmatimonadales bacterium]